MKKKHVILLLGLFLPLIGQSCRQEEERGIRIVTGGIRHETNTFTPYLTTGSDFAVFRGEKILGLDWVDSVTSQGVEVIPTTLAGAPPFGPVEGKAYETFKEEILAGIRNALPVDGVYLEMHGALHASGYDDAEADLVKSIREIVGQEVVISGSFDLHGNISEDSSAVMNILTAYRTAPHIDHAETRRRAVGLLVESIRRDLKPVIAHINVPMLISGEKAITAKEPLKSLYEQLPRISAKDGLLDASIFVGFAWADIPRAGMSIQVVAESEEFLQKAHLEAERLARELWAHKDELRFDVPSCEIDDAITDALEAEESTVFITDSGDNITGGGAGDSTIVLERLLSRRIQDAVVAGIVAPEAVKACEEAGLGSEIKLTLGRSIDTAAGKPLKVAGTVRHLKSADKKGTSLGRPRKAAVVEVEGVQVVLLDSRRAFTFPQHFEEVGIDPLQHKIVVVKLGYLTQGLRNIAPRAIMALTPGYVSQEMEKLNFENVRRPIFPLDPGMTWEPRLTTDN